ncbi:MAG: oxidoreductase, partial [Verrucomicrobiales bacterium]|nr:oxidoreductase [Verrucomicrobiales bacterium]
MSKKIKWGILGTGMIAKKFAKDLKETDLGELHATGSRSQETANLFASEYGGKVFCSYDSLINDSEIDAIYNPLPNGLHAEWSIKAMQAGKHVLCEKPMARNISEVEEMFKVSEYTGKVLIEGFMYRAHPGIQKLIETVRSGVLGKVKLIRSNFSFTREVMDSDARYKVEHAGGGLMDVGCYCVNLARAIMGDEPTETSCIAH